MEKGDKILVAGTGVSGIAAATLALNCGREVVLYDGNTSLDAGAVLLKIPGSLHERVRLILGEVTEEVLKEVGCCIISPGIPLDSPFALKVAGEGIPIFGEIEYAWRKSRGRLAAITGTNGKTTTTALTGALLRSVFEETYVLGNIGEPYSSRVSGMGDGAVTVLEVSSFQLETVKDFHPAVSAILNITPDHLNRHKTMENYIRAKEAITQNQVEADTVVLNYDDPVLRAFGRSGGLLPEVVWFSSRERLPLGFYLEGECILYADGNGVRDLVNVHEMKLLGRHNYENVMAAAATALHMGVPFERMQEVIRDFSPVEHRIEFVRERLGVRFYNDSKGTNPDAAVQALRAMPGPIVLIAGGYDKKSTYDDWVSEFEGRVKCLLLLGETKDEIARCARGHRFKNILYVKDMEEAVSAAAAQAACGDCVLLSPACASWDMFKNYEERGKVFKACVRAL